MVQKENTQMTKQTQDVVYVVKKPQESNTNWIFFLIIIIVIVCAVIYIVNSLTDAVNPFKWFGVFKSIISITDGVI